jgi:hypothetical protein
LDGVAHSSRHGSKLDSDESDDDGGAGGGGEESGEEEGKGKGKRGKKRERSQTRPTVPIDTPEYYTALKDTRTSREIVQSVKQLHAQLSESYQAAHYAAQNVMTVASRGLTELTERIQPRGSFNRAETEKLPERLEALSMEVEVVRAEPKHLSILVPLFDQYRQFYAQPSDQAGAAQFLLDRLTKNQSAIFIAVPVLSE